MADSLWMKLRKVSWDAFPCHPGKHKKLAKILENLASRKEPRAMKAAHELWSAICAGGIAPAAEPCIPFLMEILTISTPGVQSEILDILYQIATSPPPNPNAPLIPSIKKAHSVLTSLARLSKDSDVVQKANLLLQAI